MAEIVQSKPLPNNTFKVTFTCTPTHGAVTEGLYAWPDMFYHYAGENLLFTATIVGKPSSPVVEYKWDFGDGTLITGSSPTVNHVYKTTMPTTAHLRVRLESGWVGTASMNLMLKDAPELLLNNNGEDNIDNWIDYDEEDLDSTFAGGVALSPAAPTGATEGFELAAWHATNVMTSQSFPAAAGNRYRYGGWFRVAGTIHNILRFEIRNEVNTIVSQVVLQDIDGPWVRLERSFTAASTGTFSVRIRNDLGFLGGAMYFTDISVRAGY